MSILLDTNVLMRLANSADPLHRTAIGATRKLHRLEVVSVTSQVLVEFRNAATRPATVNGLGLTATEADTKVAIFEATMSLLDETPAIHPTWRRRVTAAGVVGKQVHDARIVAICQVHGVDRILTFNLKHFRRFVPHLPGLTIVDPATV